MILFWKIFTILLVAGLVNENFCNAQNIDEILPSSSKTSDFNSDFDNDVKPPKGLQIARGIGQARMKLLRNAKNLKLRLAAKRNGLKSLLTPHRSQLNTNLNKLDPLNNNYNNNDGDFGENMESTNQNYYYQRPYTVGDDLNLMWHSNNHDTNENKNSNENHKEFPLIPSQNIHNLSPTVRYRTDNDDGDILNDENSKVLLHSSESVENSKQNRMWWENQEDTSHVGDLHTYHHHIINNGDGGNLPSSIFDKISSNQFDDENSFETFSETQPKSIINVQNEQLNKNIFDEIREHVAAKATRKERQNQNVPWMMNNNNQDSQFVQNQMNRNIMNEQMLMQEMNLQKVQQDKYRNSETMYRTFSDMPNYNFQNAKPFVWYTFNDGVPSVLNSDHDRYRMSGNFHTPPENYSDNQDIIVGIKKNKKKKFKKLKKQRSGDNMEHLREENDNVNPVIMDEYLQAVRGIRHVSKPNNFQQSLSNTNNVPVKIKIFESNFKSLPNEKNTKNSKNSQLLNNLGNQFKSEQQQLLEHSSNNEKSHITNVNMVEAISKAEQKISKLEETLEKNHQQQQPKQIQNANTSKQKQNDQLQNNDDELIMQSSDPKMIIMALHARDLQKRRILNESPEHLNSVNEEPMLKRYLPTDISAEWIKQTPSSRMVSKTVENTGEKLEKIKDKKSNWFGKDIGQVIMRNDVENHENVQFKNANMMSGTQHINIPDSGYTVFEPTRTVHYRKLEPSTIEIPNNDKKIPVFEEPQTIININAAHNVENQKTVQSPVLLSQMHDPTQIYAMQFGYDQPMPQTSFIFKHQPIHELPNIQPLTYTYQGVQYRFPNHSPLQSSHQQFFAPADPILMEMGPQIPEHIGLFTPGNLYGLTKYNSGYGGYRGKLQYYQALLNKREKQLRKHHNYHRYNPDYDEPLYMTLPSNKVEKLNAAEKSSGPSSDESHYLTKRDVHQRRHRRDAGAPPPPETCPCFTQYYYGSPSYHPAYQSPIMSYNPESSYATRNDPMVGTQFTRILSRPYLGLLTPDRYRRRWFAPHEFTFFGDRHHRFQRSSNSNGTKDNNNPENEMPFFIDKNLLSKIESDIKREGGLLHNVRQTIDTGFNLVLPQLNGFSEQKSDEKQKNSKEIQVANKRVH